MRKIVLGLIGVVSSLSVHAGNCTPPAAGTVVCPAFTLCLQWQPPTTRADGVLLAASEIAGYLPVIGSTVYPQQRATALNRTLAVYEVIEAGTVVGVQAVDMSGNKSALASCALAQDYRGPVAARSAPGAPSGLTVSVQ